MSFTEESRLWGKSRRQLSPLFSNRPQFFTITRLQRKRIRLPSSLKTGPTESPSHIFILLRPPSCRTIKEPEQGLWIPISPFYMLCAWLRLIRQSACAPCGPVTEDQSLPNSPLFLQCTVPCYFLIMKLTIIFIYNRPSSSGWIRLAEKKFPDKRWHPFQRKQDLLFHNEGSGNSWTKFKNTALMPAMNCSGKKPVGGQACSERTKIFLQNI